MRPLNITILQGAFFPVPAVRGGAVEKLWHRLAVEFAAQGHAVTQISRQVPELPIGGRLDGVDHQRVPGYDQPRGGLKLKWRDLRYTLRALRAAPAGDILVTNTFWAPLLAPRRLGKIFVSVERMPKGQMRFYRRATGLRACSQAVGDAIRREAPRLAGRVVVVPNPLPSVPVAAVDFSAKKEEILFVGRIHPAKGVEMLLRAFILAKQQGLLSGRCRLVLVGPADEKKGGGGAAWWNQVLEKEAHPDIAWRGPVYDPEALNTLYREARVLAYPTVDERGEAMPIAPLEAMAWGCVPVVSGLACFRDYLQDGVNGLVFDHAGAKPEEALARALSRAAEPTSVVLGQRALGVRTTHAPDRIAALLIELFYNAMKNQGECA